jgi:hypothetical protein
MVAQTISSVFLLMVNDYDQKTIQLSIADTLSGIKSYTGYLNGKWILFEYDKLETNAYF